MVAPLRVVVTDAIVSRFEPLFRSLSPHHDWHFAASMAPGPQLELIAEADVLVCARLSAEQAAATRAGLVHVTGSGTDRLALDRLSSGTTVARTAHHERAIAEHILMVILAAQRRLLEVTAQLRAGSWQTLATDPQTPLHRTLAELTIGFVGLGAIGTQALELCGSLGARCVAVRRTVPEELPPHAAWVGTMDALPRLLSEADVLVLCVPLTDETTGLIGSEQLAALRPGAVLVNVARGPVLDLAALHEALDSGHLGAAALDVWWQAPEGMQAPEDTRRLANHPRVIATPHYSGHSNDTFTRRVQEICANIDGYANCLPVRNAD